MVFSLVDLQVLAKAYAFPDGQWKTLRFNISVHAEDFPSHKLCQSAQYHNLKKNLLADWFGKPGILIE